MNIQDKIITQYKDYMSKIEQQFPIPEEILKNEHKKIKSQLFSKRNTLNFPSSLEKKIESEYMNYINQNDFAYYSKLNILLIDEYKPIKENINNNNYDNIENYIEDLKTFEASILSGKKSIPDGPNKILHINEFIYEQLLEDCETLINNCTYEYDTQFDKNKKEADEILNEINQLNDDCKKIMMKIKEKENLIKQIDMDKKLFIKQATSHSDKISNSIKIKTDMINRLNQEIENIENKHDIIIKELKNKIKKAENIKLEKEKNTTE